MLKVEWIRHFFFHVPITPRIKGHAQTLGLDGLATLAEHQLMQGKMLQFNPDWDFNQTKMLDGNIVHWARHAVACCCRKCMAYWHNVPTSARLSAQDVEYFKQLIILYIRQRIPDLQYAPAPRKPAQKSVVGRRKAG
jgi:hypothetical protein